MAMKDRHQLEGQNFEFDLFCFSCFQSNHSVFNCPAIHLVIDNKSLIHKRNFSENQIRTPVIRHGKKKSNALKLKKKIVNSLCKLSFELYYASRDKKRRKDLLICLESTNEEKIEAESFVTIMSPLETYTINEAKNSFSFNFEEEKEEVPEENNNENEIKENNRNSFQNVLRELQTFFFQKDKNITLNIPDLFNYLLHKEEICIDQMKSYKFYNPHNNIENVVQLCKSTCLSSFIKFKKNSN